MTRTYFVYLLASRSQSLYVGVTNEVGRRMVEHRDGLVPGFTSRYRIFRLVHLEVFGDIRSAIAREKKIKAWRREKKIWLIERENPTWEDMARNSDSEQGRRTTDPSPPSPKTGDRVRDDSASGSGAAAGLW